MQLDFHYCTIRILAEKAGFSAEDAQIISYASQYIDDAVDHEKMYIDGSLDILLSRFTENTFDPICTAHKGLQFINGYNQGVQNKIYIPFHFLPDLENSLDMNVTQNCRLSLKLVNKALVELCKGVGEQRIMNLIRLGITLHTYADSWAHQNFSGKHNPKANDIRDITLFKNGKWETIPFLTRLEYNSLPDIGHAEAASYPDQSHLKWSYVRVSDGKTYIRDNTLLFLDAAEHIFNLLKGKVKDEIWFEIKDKLFECLSFEAESVEEKIKKFQSIFPEIGFFYDEKQWRKDALLTVKRSKLYSVVKDNKHLFELGSDKKWFYFHYAALEQREYIYELIQKIERETVHM